MSGCVMCQIIQGDLRAKVLYQDDLVLCLDLPKDHPVRMAPVHFMVVPKEHIPSARETEARHEPALGRLVTVAPPASRARWASRRAATAWPATPVTTPGRRSSTCTCTVSAAGSSDQKGRDTR